jgi:hypothetical protein
MSSNFTCTHEILDSRTHRYVIRRGETPLTFQEVLRLWQTEEPFRQIFIALLADSPFAAFRWETPPISLKSVNRSFEFVLLDSPGLDRRPEREAFATQFADCTPDVTITSFENLGRDATLIVPTPQGADGCYVHLARFLREGPVEQRHHLWREVGETVCRRLSDQPLWLSTAGAGVAWLHVRLDSRPKYYGHGPYRNGR